MYINTTTDQYPVSEGEIRAAHPNTSFTVPFAAPEPYEWVFPKPAPVYDPITHRVQEIAPVISALGKYEQAWQVVAFSEQQILDNQETQRITAIPRSVSPRQIRQALTAAGLRASVEAAIAASDQDTKDWYEFATEFERSHPMVIALATALNVTARQLDDLWTLAGSL